MEQILPYRLQKERSPADTFNNIKTRKYTKKEMQIMNIKLLDTCNTSLGVTEMQLKSRCKFPFRWGILTKMGHTHCYEDVVR